MAQMKVNLKQYQNCWRRRNKTTKINKSNQRKDLTGGCQGVQDISGKSVGGSQVWLCGEPCTIGSKVKKTKIGKFC